MITIHNLEVQFDVEGDDQRAAFSRLFSEFMKRWAAQAEEEQKRELDLSRERDLSRRPMGVN